MASAPTAATTSEELATVTVSLPTNLLREIDETARAERRSRGDLLAGAAEYYLSARRWRAIHAVSAPRAEAAGLGTEEDIEELIDSLPDSD